MNTPFAINFKNMCMIVCKSALQEKDCPVNNIILGKLIDFTFSSDERINFLSDSYRKNRIRVDIDYKKNGKKFDDIIKNRDRNVFKYIDVFPPDVLNQFGNYIEWFSNYIINRMPEKHMEIVWRYVEKIDKYLS